MACGCHRCAGWPESGRERLAQRVCIPLRQTSERFRRPFMSCTRTSWQHVQEHVALSAYMLCAPALFISSSAGCTRHKMLRLVAGADLHLPPGNSICLSRAVPSRGSDRGLEISLIFYLLLQALQDSQSRRACTQSSAAGRQPCKQLGGRCGGRRGAAHGGCQQRVLRRNGGGCGGRLADVAGRGCSALAASRRGRNACRGTLRAMSLPLHGCGL